jgi:HK97 family phage portal protein
MSTLNDDNWWSRFRGSWNSGGKNARLDKGDTSIPFAGDSTAAGNSITPDKALKLATVWACVRLRSETIASLPFHLRDDNKDLAKNHPLYRILHDQPNADMTASEFWEAMVASQELDGNGYALIHRNTTKTVIALDFLDPSLMQVSRSTTGEIKYTYKKGSKNEVIYNEDDILHLKGFSLDCLVGLSAIKYQSAVIGGQIDANSAANAEFKNNLKAGGFLKTGEKLLNNEQRDRLRKNLATFGEPQNAGKWMVLEAGMEPASASSVRISAQDAQLLENRRFGIEEICRTFKTPPQLIYHMDKASSWASSLEQMNLGYLTYGLRPTLVRIEQMVSRKLLTPEERKKYSPKFSVEGLLRADSAARSGFYSQLLQNGVMTRNEVRALEDLPAHTGADQLTVQLNLTPIELLGRTNEQTKDQTD